MVMAMTDEIVNDNDRRNHDDADEGSHHDDADSMLKREAIVKGMLIAWLHICHNHVRTFNFV